MKHIARLLLSREFCARSAFSCALAALLAAPLGASATDFTWTGGAGDGLWETPGNWDKNASYPKSGSDKAIFAADANAAVTLAADLTFNTLSFGANATVTIATDTAGTLRKLTPSVLTLSNAGTSVVLDGAGIHRGGDITLGTSVSVSLKNGGYFYVNRLTASDSQTLSVASGSTASINNLVLGATSSATVDGNGSTLTFRAAPTINGALSVTAGATVTSTAATTTINAGGSLRLVDSTYDSTGREINNLGTIAATNSTFSCSSFKLGSATVASATASFHGSAVTSTGTTQNYYGALSFTGGSTVAFTAGSGTPNVYGTGSLLISGGSTVSYASSNQFNLYGSLVAEGGSSLSLNAGLVTYPIATYPNSSILLDDSRLTLAGQLKLANEASSGGANVTFKGANPVLSVGSKVTSWNNASSQAMNFTFVVPEGGFVEPPLQCNPSSAKMFDGQGNLPAGAFKVNVANDSPALAAGTTTTCPLLVSPAGFNRYSAIPDITGGTDVSLVFSNATATAAASSDATAQVLWATVGSGPAAAQASVTASALSRRPSASITRYLLSAKGFATALSTVAAETVLELWVGTTSDTNAMSVASSAAVTQALAEQTLTFDVPQDGVPDKTYYWCLVLRDKDAEGGTLSLDASSVGTASITDNTTYTWQAVDGEWSGAWTNAAHWANNSAARYDYPDSTGATADFGNCPEGTAVTVAVDGNFKAGTTKFYSSAHATDIAFAGTGTTTSGLATSGGTGNGVITKSDSRVEFRNLSITSSTQWELVRSDTVTNVTVRFDGAKMTGSGIMAVSAPFCRFEFVGGSDISCTGRINFGGTNTVVLIDDSTVQSGNAVMFNGDCNVNGNLEVVFKGAAPKLIASSYFGARNNNAATNCTFVFTVPVGGYAEPPIKMTSSNLTLFTPANGGSYILNYNFRVDEDSPALKKSSGRLENIVIADTVKGIETDKITEFSVPEHDGVSCGTFKYGVNGAPLADGADLSTARQILLDLKGWGSPMVIIVR
ncbi:MAG: hypothetical protein IJI36_19950 [Kiritimatiellae bacterium]|nr:hypothetical protein [Kiritimatiellia bacterium]MBQ6341419.1 hypothetical protein [Kiritimatiellia bacterium]